MDYEQGPTLSEGKFEANWGQSMRFKMFDNNEQQKGTVDAVTISPEDAAEELMKVDTLGNTLSMEWSSLVLEEDAI